MISFKKTREIIAANKIKLSRLANETNLSPLTIQNMLKDKGVTTETINKICSYFRCQPSELMEWIPDGKTETEIREEIDEKKRQIEYLYNVLNKTDNTQKVNKESEIFTKEKNEKEQKEILKAKGNLEKLKIEHLYLKSKQQKKINKR